MQKSVVSRTLLNALGVAAYVAVVATIMRNGERLFGQMTTVLAATAFLLLFCVSAAVVGSLVFGYPAVLFMNGQKREAITAVVMTIGWLALITVTALVTVALI
ncbi:MAG: hypothetical protein V1907_04300 [Candidatus Kerfeldbacteria bacterium]